MMLKEQGVHVASEMSQQEAVALDGASERKNVHEVQTQLLEQFEKRFRKAY